MKLFYITGVSGVGKSTFAASMNERGIPAIDIDSVPELCRWVHKTTGERAHWLPGIGKEFFESHEYVCDKEKLAALLEQYKDKDYAFVVGLADNQAEILPLFDKIFLFHCAPEIFLEHITTRTNHGFGKHQGEPT